MFTSHERENERDYDNFSEFFLDVCDILDIELKPKFNISDACRAIQSKHG